LWSPFFKYIIVFLYLSNSGCQVIFFYKKGFLLRRNGTAYRFFYEETVPVLRRNGTGFTKKRYRKKPKTFDLARLSPALLYTPVSLPIFKNTYKENGLVFLN